MNTQTLARNLTIVLACVLVGCQTDQSTTSNDGLKDASTPLSGPSPISEKARLKQEAWARATEGLNFNEGTGRMEIEPLVGLNQNALSELMSQGDYHIAHNQYVEAFGAYGRWVRAEPTNTAAYNKMAMALVPQGKSKLSEMILQTALDVDASSLDSWSNLAKVQATQGNHGQAIITMQQALALDPDYGEGWERLAVWHFYAGNIDAASKSVDRAKQLGASVPAQLLANIERAKQK